VTVLKSIDSVRDNKFVYSHRTQGT